MRSIPFILSILFSIFSTAVMSYVSLATPIGPWIAPTIVLCCILLSRVFTTSMQAENMALVTAASTIGGIMATAAAFSFPTLYFLDKQLFNSWVAHPLYFVGMLSGLALCAGWFGIFLANIFEEKLVVREELAFPIGQMAHKMIVASGEIRKALEMVVGFALTAVFCVLQDGLLFVRGFIPRALTLIQKTAIGIITVPQVSLNLMPMWWAIGFVTGHVIAIPLAVGALSRIFLLDTLRTQVFPEISSMEFVFAFCSGMVVIGALLSFSKLPKLFSKSVGGVTTTQSTAYNFDTIRLIEMGAGLLLTCAFLTYVGFPLIAQIYTLAFTSMCTYEMMVQGGKLGLARLGTFATFVMVPAMFLFSLTMVQIVFIAVFVQICGGVAVDVLFGRKLAQLSGIARTRVMQYQYLGLLVSACALGLTFLFLVGALELGSCDLSAQKAQNRQLLIHAQNFNLYVMIIGAVFGLVLKKVRVNASLVLGGLLMPINVSLGLIAGGALTLLTKEKEDWYPFWSGVFASNSLWMLFRAIATYVCT